MNRQGIIYGQWREKNMKEALLKYKSAKLGWNEICPMYNFLKRTLIRRLNSSNSEAKGVNALGRFTIFNADIEVHLENQL